jgi:hypothetical protein
MLLVVYLSGWLVGGRFGCAVKTFDIMTNEFVHASTFDDMTNDFVSASFLDVRLAV